MLIKQKKIIPSREAGFTLIEVLMAIAVLSIGMFLIGVGVFSSVNAISKVNKKNDNNVILLKVVSVVEKYVERVMFPFWEKPEVKTANGGKGVSINYFDGDPDKLLIIEFEDGVFRIGGENEFFELTGLSDVTINLNNDPLENLGLVVTIKDYTSQGFLFPFSYGSIP